MSGARRREGRQAGEREEATAAQAAGTRWSRLVLGAGHTSLSLLRFCSSGCIDMRAAHTVNRPTDWVLVGFHRSAGLGAPCSATSLVFSPAFIATRAESERGASRAGHAGKLRPILAGRQKNALAARLSRRFLSWLWWRRPPQGHLPPSRADRSVVFLVFYRPLPLATSRDARLVMLVPAVDEVPAPRCLPPTGTRGL